MTARPRHGKRSVLVIHHGSGPDRLVTSPNDDVTTLTAALAPGLVTRSRRVPGAVPVSFEFLPDVEAMAERLGWFVVRQAAPRPAVRQAKRGLR